ncbi:hypothetical protein [Kitasatospora mediocidica]|uniref:hypothetical protein n=1 Tax=Kitasatospora mediocidica TaxID=58352 RepID=UPI00056C8EF3|nr:hypothetical protein [Kitasatospora mediocidica]
MVGASRCGPQPFVYVATEASRERSRGAPGALPAARRGGVAPVPLGAPCGGALAAGTPEAAFLTGAGPSDAAPVKRGRPHRRQPTCDV